MERAEWIIFFKKRVLSEWFMDRWKEQMHVQTFRQQKNVRSNLNPLLLYFTLFFLYDPFTTSLHALKKSIIHGAINKKNIPISSTNQEKNLKK